MDMYTGTVYIPYFTVHKCNTTSEYMDYVFINFMAQLYKNGWKWPLGNEILKKFQKFSKVSVRVINNLLRYVVFPIYNIGKVMITLLQYFPLF